MAPRCYHADSGASVLTTFSRWFIGVAATVYVGIAVPPLGITALARRSFFF
jgi:hypothetical protein